MGLVFTLADGLYGVDVSQVHETSPAPNSQYYILLDLEKVYFEPLIQGSVVFLIFIMTGHFF